MQNYGLIGCGDDDDDDDDDDDEGMAMKMILMPMVMMVILLLMMKNKKNYVHRPMDVGKKTILTPQFSHPRVGWRKHTCHDVTLRDTSQKTPQMLHFQRGEVQYTKICSVCKTLVLMVDMDWYGWYLVSKLLIRPGPSWQPLAVRYPGDPLGQAFVSGVQNEWVVKSVTCRRVWFQRWGGALKKDEKQKGKSWEIKLPFEIHWNPIIHVVYYYGFLFFLNEEMVTVDMNEFRP